METIIALKSIRNIKQNQEIINTETRKCALLKANKFS